MSEKNNDKEILVVMRGTLRMQRNTNEVVEGMFFLVTGKTSYYSHGMFLYLRDKKETPRIPPIDKAGLYSFLDRIYKKGEKPEEEKNPFLRGLGTNLDYVLTRFLLPKDMDSISQDLKGGARKTALNLTNYLENSYGVETHISVILERKPKEELSEYLGENKPLAPPANEEKPEPETEKEISFSQPQEKPRAYSCSLIIDPIQGIPVNTLEKGYDLSVAFPEGSTNPWGVTVTDSLGSKANPVLGKVQQVLSLEDGGYVVQMILDGNPPAMGEAVLDGNYRIRLWKGTSEKDLSLQPPDQPPQSEKALLYIAFTIAVAAILALGYYILTSGS